jgi:transcriptional regulator with XRE-family HTH domain
MEPLQNSIKEKAKKRKAKRFQLRRLAMGMTVNALAKMLQVGHATLRAYEQGAVKIPDEKYIKSLHIFYKWKNDIIKELKEEIRILNNLLND